MSPYTATGRKSDMSAEFGDSSFSMASVIQEGDAARPADD
jgi:hypothetical protein